MCTKTKKGFARPPCPGATYGIVQNNYVFYKDLFCIHFDFLMAPQREKLERMMLVAIQDDTVLYSFIEKNIATNIIVL